MKKLFLAFLLLIASVAASAQSGCAINPGACQAAPVPSDCAAGSHWTTLGSGIAHCVANDPPCAGVVTHDSMGNPTGCTPVVTSTSTESQTISCPANYSGSQTQQRTVQNWSDGTTTYGSWTTTSSSCTYVPPTCANGATDYPTCTPPTCANGATDYPTCTPPTCANGATNYPTCTPPTCANGATNYPTCTLAAQAPPPPPPAPSGMSILAGSLGGIGYELGPGGAGSVTNANYYAGQSILEVMDTGSQVYVIYPGVVNCSAFTALIINGRTLPFTNCLQNWGDIGSYSGPLTYWITSNGAGLQVGTTYPVVLQ